VTQLHSSFKKKRREGERTKRNERAEERARAKEMRRRERREGERRRERGEEGEEREREIFCIYIVGVRIFRLDFLGFEPTTSCMERHLSPCHRDSRLDHSATSTSLKRYPRFQ
jgi:hypothetical protein